MAEVKKMFNAVTLDQEFASDVWFALYDAAQNPEATGVDQGFMELADRLALKMYDQDCGLSSKLEAAGLLAPWMKPIVDRITDRTNAFTATLKARSEEEKEE